MNRKATSMKMLCSLLALLLVIGGIPAFAAEPVSTTSGQEELSATQALALSGSEFDFSDTDELDKYDTYEKRTDDIIQSAYVSAPLKNSIDTIKNPSIDWGRYGAFLRDADEVQIFSYILGAPSSFSKIQDKYLTVYADPEVAFEVIDHTNNVIARSTGWFNSSSVNRLKKTIDGDNIVYFIELKQPTSGANRQYIKFTTESTTTQPHYSYWFGHPLTKQGTATGGTFTVSVTAPNRSSSSVTVRAPSVPEFSWVNSVVFDRTSTSGDAYLNNATLALTLQDGRTHPGLRTSNSRMTIDTNFNASSANPAGGSYSVNLMSVSWNSGVRAGSRYSYRAKMTVNYLYAFGA